MILLASLVAVFGLQTTEGHCVTRLNGSGRDTARVHGQHVESRFEASFATPLGFTKAKPVWVKGREKEMNVTLRFTESFAATGREKRIFLRVTGVTFYRIRLNGVYVGYGPARGPKGFDRIDEWDLAKFAEKGANALEIDVTGSFCPCYYVTEQPSYLQAEVVADGKILTATDVRTFVASELNREIKVPRYSFQRPFCEVWNEPYRASSETLELAVQPAKKFLPRRADYPTFALNEKAVRIAEGKVRYDASVPLREYRPLLRTGAGRHDSHGYATNVCRVLPSVEADRYLDDPNGACRAEMWDFGLLDCGFIGLKARAKGKGRVVLSFDEVLTNGKVDFLRGGTANVVIWNLDGAGDYALETIEPYAFRYAKIVLDGDMTIGHPYIRTYKSPAAADARAPTKDPVLSMVYGAACETFRQNAVDVFTDCPGRERAGWLCDSFFTARVSKLLTGSLALEELFLENYLLAEEPNIPQGMFPMCYPADHIDRNFIPNWAMWLVLELGDYLERGGDPALVKRFEPKVTAFVKYLSGFENADGLLEKLPAWVFIEWSAANEFTQDVNYPSNMTWARVLETVAKLYDRPELARKAESVREMIRRQSFDGMWFRDNAVRGADGKLSVTTNHTETCQYYAFFFGTATPKTHAKLWKTLVNDFGPERKTKDSHPDVPFSNAFVGNYLRLDLLQQAGFQDRVEANVRGYFGGMAERTGTLWEMDTPTASCCHGFASYAAVFIDRLHKEVSP